MLFSCPQADSLLQFCYLPQFEAHGLQFQGFNILECMCTGITIILQMCTYLVIKLILVTELIDSVGWTSLAFIW